ALVPAGGECGKSSSLDQSRKKVCDGRSCRSGLLLGISGVAQLAKSYGAVRHVGQREQSPDAGRQITRGRGGGRLDESASYACGTRNRARVQRSLGAEKCHRT